ncbi:MAG: MFS transporter [Janthinobacterium lividum]
MKHWSLKQWGALSTLSFAVLMVSLDITVVSVAIPSIERDLHLDFEHLQWIVNAYTLSYGSLLLAAGACADRCGRRRIFLFGIVLFAAASAACGFAFNGIFLNVARAAQGAGGACVASCSMALVASTFEARDRSMAYGIWATAGGLGLALGPTFGGQILSQSNWHWIFFINLPVALWIALLVPKLLRESAIGSAGRFDFPGFACFTPGLIALIYALMRGNHLGWSNLSEISLIALALSLLSVFVAVERRSSHPMFDLKLFAVPSFIGVLVVAVAASVGYWSLFVYVPLYLTRAAQLGAAEIGLALLPLSLPMLIVPPFAARLSRLLAPQVQFAGGLAIIGLADLALASAIHAEFGIAIPLLTAGTGAGLINAQITHVAIGVVPGDRTGMAAGISATSRQFGYALGVAGLGAVITSTSHSALVDGLAMRADLALEVTAAARELGNSNLPVMARFPEALQRLLFGLVGQSFAEGFHAALLVAAAVSFTGAALAAMLVRRTDLC